MKKHNNQFSIAVRDCNAKVGTKNKTVGLRCEKGGQLSEFAEGNRISQEHTSSQKYEQETDLEKPSLRDYERNRFYSFLKFGRSKGCNSTTLLRSSGHR